jgi:3-oxoacyl-[acyl-carrier protein] reductase
MIKGRSGMAAFDFSGKQVLVTGGSAGIGHGIGVGFRDAGADVIVTGTRAADAYETDFTGLTYRQLDVCSDEEIAALAADVDRMDVVVNSAGIAIYGRKEYEIETFQKVLDVNLTGTMRVCNQFHDMIKDSGGSIINIASGASFFATPGTPGYNSSKGGVAMLTKCLATAWGKEGVRVNAVAPGYVETAITKVVRENEKVYEASVKKTPLRRWGTPEDMAGITMFLASPYASFITGQTIMVDGGMSLSI